MFDHDNREPCSCQWPQAAVQHDLMPVKQFADNRFYLIAQSEGGIVPFVICFCPCCGGKLPIDRKLVDEYDDSELEEIQQLLPSLTSPESVQTILGNPDEIRSRRFPIRELIYEKRWKTIVLCVCEVNDGSITTFYFRKTIQSSFKTNVERSFITW